MKTKFTFAICGALFLGQISLKAQTILTEDFSTWGVIGLNPYIKDSCVSGGASYISQPGGNTVTRAFGDPIKGGAFDTTVTYGASPIKFSLINAGVAPTCGTRGLGSTVSNGYIVLSKTSSTLAMVSGSTTDGHGELILPTLPYVYSVKVGISFTGTYRGLNLYTSTDGSTWDLVPGPTQITDKTGLVLTPVGQPYPTFFSLKSGQTGETFTIMVNKANVMLKFSTEDKPVMGFASQITRIHDLTIEASDPSSLSKNIFESGKATVEVSNNSITVGSTEKGIVEIIQLNGTVVTTSDLNAQSKITVPVSQAGLYIVKLATNNGVYAKKVVVN